MYIVSRKRDESVIVDGFNSPRRELKVTVMEVRNGRVKLCFEVNADAAAPTARPGNRSFDFHETGREMIAPETFGE